jgi:hypothetical protein
VCYRWTSEALLIEAESVFICLRQLGGTSEENVAGRIVAWGRAAAELLSFPFSCYRQI